MPLQPAFVLHARPYRETSQLVELFSAEAGRLSLVARGSRTARSPLKGVLQPFMPLSVSWRGTGELKNLDQVEACGPLIALPGERLFSGLYLNELLYYLLERHTPFPELFSYYRQALELLAAGPDPQPVLRQFELLLLECLGYGVDFFHAADSGEPLQPDAGYRYLAESGFVHAEAGQSGGNLYLGAELLALGAHQFTEPAVLRAAKRFCRQALAPLLGSRALKSRALFSTHPTRRVE